MREKPPTLFIEDVENALMTDEVLGNGFVCPVCKYLVSLYDDHKVNIVFTSSNARTRNLLQGGININCSKLNSLEKLYKDRMDFYELPQQNLTQIEDYLLNKINLEIQNDTKKFTSENIGNLIQNLGWNNDFVDEYVSDLGAYEDLNGRTSSICYL